MVLDKRKYQTGSQRSYRNNDFKQKSRRMSGNRETLRRAKVAENSNREHDMPVKPTTASTRKEPNPPQNTSAQIRK